MNQASDLEKMETMRTPIINTLFSLAALLASQAPLAQDNIVDIHQLALENDPSIKAAEAAYNAVLTSKPQARSLLLPNVSFSANTSDNSTDSSTSGRSDYNSNGYSLNLTQPLFRYDYWIQHQQADSSIGQAQAEYLAAQQELIVRVAEAYFNLLAAEDGVAFAAAEKSAISRQLEQAQKRFEVGLIAITDVHEAQAAYDLSLASELEAENRVLSAREALNEITGQFHEEIAALDEGMPMAPPDPASLEQWSQFALEQNLQLQATQHAMKNAQQNIQLNRAGHLPTLDLVATHNDSDVGGGFGGSRETETDTIALQFNLSLFEGGRVQYKTREATHLYQQAKETTEQQRRATLRQVRDAYRGVLTGISRVKALKQATVSTQSALDATEAGFEVGTRTIVDVLSSQRELYRARRDYAQARYDYALNSLRLKQAAGMLAPENLQQINQWLQ
jgi:outer membrane protein